MEFSGFIASDRVPEAGSARRKPAWGDAGKGLLASLLLHLGIAVATFGAIAVDPSHGLLPVIDLTLLPPSGIGSTTTAEQPPPPHANPGPSLARFAPPPFPPAEPEEAQPAPTEETTPPAAQPAVSAQPIEMPVVRTASAQGSEGSPSTPGTYSPGSTSGIPSAPATNPQALWTGPGREGPEGPGRDARKRYLERNYASIREAIQHGIPYPAVARRMGWEGKVVVGFQVLTDGSVRNVRVVDGSGHAVLDRSAVLAVQGAAPFPRPPVEAEIITPVVYRLE